jgi:hypothetical protein
MTDLIESVKKAAEKAAKAAQELMSDKPPGPVELGGVADKQPKPGGAVVISPMPLPATPGSGPPDMPGGSSVPKTK